MKASQFENRTSFVVVIIYSSDFRSIRSMIQMKTNVTATIDAGKKPKERTDEGGISEI